MYHLRMLIWNLFSISLGSMRSNKKGRIINSWTCTWKITSSHKNNSELAFLNSYLPNNLQWCHLGRSQWSDNCQASSKTSGSINSETHDGYPEHYEYRHERAFLVLKCKTMNKVQHLHKKFSSTCIQVCNALVQFHTGVSPSQQFKLEKFSNIADILGNFMKIIANS